MIFEKSSASRILVFIGKNGWNQRCAALSLHRSRDRFWNDFYSFLALKMNLKSVQNQSWKAFNFVFMFRRLPKPVKISFAAQHAPNLPLKMTPDWAKSPTKNRPKSIQHGSGSGAGSITDIWSSRTDFGLILGRFWNDFCSILDRFLVLPFAIPTQPCLGAAIVHCAYKRAAWDHLWSRWIRLRSGPQINSTFITP